MQKDFIKATPDSGGSGSTTVTATAPANQTESARSTSLSVAGGGMTRTVGASQAARVVTWNYYFSVTPTSLSFVAGGESKTVTVTSYRKKVINGVETSTQENVNWTPTVSGTGFSVSGSTVTAAGNSATTTRSGTATYTQTTSGKTASVSLSQAAGVVTWNYYFSVTPTSLSFVAGGESKTVTVTSYRKKVVNGVETSTQENVSWSAKISGTGFSKNTNGSSITAAENQSDIRLGTVSYTQTTSGKTALVSLSQEAGVQYTVTYKNSGSSENIYYAFNLSSTPNGTPSQYIAMTGGEDELKVTWSPNTGYLVNNLAGSNRIAYVTPGYMIWIRKLIGMKPNWSSSTIQSFRLEANDQTVYLE